MSGAVKSSFKAMRGTSLAACEMAGGSADHRRQRRRLRGEHLARQHGRHARRHARWFGGRAGDRGSRDRMRRGTAVVFGDAGDFLASRMVAGTIAVGGARWCAPAGYGMRRGSVVLAGAEPPRGADFRARRLPTWTGRSGSCWRATSRVMAGHKTGLSSPTCRHVESKARPSVTCAADGKGELIHGCLV